MAQAPSAQNRQQGLQQAASVVFALMGILPLLLFAFTLWQLGAIHRALAQVSLVLTLVLMLLGFWLFRSMLARMSENVTALTRAVGQALRTRPAAAPVSAPAPVGLSAAPRPAAPRAPAVPAPPAVAPQPARPAPERQVAGLGAIKELGEIAHTMDLLWQREARTHVGRRVQISVANSQELAGTLVEATDEGLILEQADGATVAITYRRVQGIEPLAGGG
jgi:hypothetical protein